MIESPIDINLEAQEGNPYIQISWFKNKLKNINHKRVVWVLFPVNNTSVCKYWKILFYPPNTDTGTFYRGYTDIDTDAQYPRFNTVIPYSREQKHVSISDTPMLLIEISSISNMGCQKKSCPNELK